MPVAWNSRANQADEKSAAPAADSTSAADRQHREDVREQDRAVIQRIRSGDADAFHELVDRYAGRLYSAAYALVGNSADAEDVVQETLAGAFTSARSFRGEASVKTWLLKILVRQAARNRRSRKRWRFLSLSLSSDGSTDDAATPMEPAVKGSQGEAESRLDVPEMLKVLSFEHREVIMLRELQGMSYEEMAETLGVPRGTVESRLHRARRELKDKFAADFGG